MDTQIENQTNQNNFNRKNNIFQGNFYSEIANSIKSTLGPSGMEKFIKKSTGEIIITNDGATILNNIS